MPSLSVASSDLASVCFPGPTGICAECSRNTILSLATPSRSRQRDRSVHHPRGIEGAIDQVHIHTIKPQNADIQHTILSAINKNQTYCTTLHYFCCNPLSYLIRITNDKDQKSPNGDMGPSGYMMQRMQISSWWSWRLEEAVQILKKGLKAKHWGVMGSR